MRRATRTQADDFQAELSEATGLWCPASEDKTDQDGKHDADLNVVLRRFGVQSLRPKPTQYGEMDFTVDLQQAYAKVLDAREAYPNLPQELRSLYPTFEQLMDALRRGEIEITPVKASDVPSEAAAGVGNRSAAEGGSGSPGAASAADPRQLEIPGVPPAQGGGA